MTRPALVDPFADTEIQSAMSQLPSRDHSLRRLFGDRVRPKTIPLGETSTPSQIPSSNLTTSNAVLSIDRQPDDAPTSQLDGTAVQPAPVQYRPATPDRASALRLLRSVPSPLTVSRVSRALQWTERRSKSWLHEFQAKRLLVKVSRTEWRWV